LKTDNVKTILCKVAYTTNMFTWLLLIIIPASVRKFARNRTFCIE